MADIHFIEGQIGEITGIDTALLAVIVGSIIVGIVLEHWRAYLMRGHWRARKGRRRHQPAGTELWMRRFPISTRVDTARPDTARPDAAEQLRVVTNARFEKRRLLNAQEVKVFHSAERAVEMAGQSWRVMAQVSLGEILSSPDSAAYAAINSKRVDILIVTHGGDPIAAVEHQGDGHYQGSAPARDAVKKEALRKAGIYYIETTPEHGPDDLAYEIARIARIVGSGGLGRPELTGRPTSENPSS